ncbi:MAG: DHHW family protein, partial [Oscillospiraceae bacterium]|nr:DHHW family protein [Oscillospiraceae bacterium]
KMFGMLDGAIPVDVYPELSAKVHEDIFLRTDHHWAPLGAYYAAEKFAEVAGVPFAPLSDYDVSVVPNYVGSMYSYSGKDPRVGNSPEDFVYYKPRNSYKTTYYNTYTGQNPSVAVEGSLFVEGMNLADTYSTFMGGDAKITHITTDVKNGRKLAIIKESMGNALVPFFTNSFEEIYVIDVRFFPYNAVSYLSERGVTDLLFATSMAMANDGGFVGKIEGLMGN